MRTGDTVRSGGDQAPSRRAFDERPSRAELLSRRLEEVIVGRGLPPGERIGTKEELRQEYRVAPSTLNEALRLLQTRGLVELKPGPGGGVFASEPTPWVRLHNLVLGVREGERDLVADCLAVRDALEPLVLAEAAEGITGSETHELHALVDEMAAAASDATSYLRANWRLHRRLAHLCGNSVLQGIYLTLLDALEDTLSDVTPDPAFAGHSTHDIDLHRRMVEAVIARDQAAARQAALEHPTVIKPHRGH